MQVFQEVSLTEIRPDSSGVGGDHHHLLEFEDGSEVYDIAAYSLCSVS